MKTLIHTIYNGIVVSRPVYMAKLAADGKTTFKKCSFIVSEDLNKGEKHYTSITACGGLADCCAKNCCPGTIVDITTKPLTFLGVVYDKDGNRVIGKDGEGVFSRRTTYIIDNIILSGMTKEAIDAEIAEGIRPKEWNNPAHPDCDIWRTINMARNKVEYNSDSENFGYAHVCKPGEPFIAEVLDMYKEKRRPSHVRAFNHHDW